MRKHSLNDKPSMCESGQCSGLMAVEKLLVVMIDSVKWMNRDLKWNVFCVVECS